MVNADSFFKRLIGLAFQKEIKYSMKFERCNGIHTFFMKCNIDVYMVDCNNKILFVFKDFKKNRIIFPKKDVYSVYETKVNEYSFNVGDTFIE